jgi:hypothetical protein
MAPYLARVLIALAACGGDVVIVQDGQLDSTTDSGAMTDTATIDEPSDSPCEGAEVGAPCGASAIECAPRCGDIPGWSCVNGAWQETFYNCLCVN